MCHTIPQDEAEEETGYHTRCSCQVQWVLMKSIQYYCRGADKPSARPGRKQTWKHVRDARDFNNIETRAVIKVFFLQGKAPKEIHAMLTETLSCFLPVRAKDLSAPLFIGFLQ